MTSRSSLLIATLLVGLFTSTAFPVQAQSAPAAAGHGSGPGGSSSSTYSLIHVNATAGSDSSGNGGQMQPLKTITHALRMARPGTVILLSPGEYSEASGETFPLQLRPGVTVQGAPIPGGGDVIIRGGGIYTSPSQGLESVTILAVDRAGLGNVVVTNPYNQGHGVWIETGSPVLRDNIFVANGHSGVYIAGPGAPQIQRNRFTANGVTGLFIGSGSQAEVQGNLFENTGTGIQVAPGAAPRIADNQIVQNQDGLVIAASAQPILGNNLINGNRRNALIDFQPPPTTAVLVSTSQPALLLNRPAQLGASGPADSAIAASPPATRPVPQLATPPAAAQLTPAAPAAPVETATATAQPAQATAPAAATMPRSSVEPEAASAPEPAPESAALAPAESAQTVAPAAPATLAALRARLQANRQASSATGGPDTAGPETAGPETADPETASSEAASVEIAVTPPPETPPATRLVALRDRLRQNQANQPADSSLPLAAVATAPAQPAAATLNLSPENEAVTALPLVPTTGNLPTTPAVPAATLAQTVPTDTLGLLQVPGPNIPVGSGGGSLPQVLVNGSAGGPPAPPSRAANLGLHYKVLVAAADEATQNRVRAAVPDAFRVRFEGQTMMQAGAFPDEATAAAIAATLTQQGLAARVQYVP